MRFVILILTLSGSLTWNSLNAQKDPPSLPPPPKTTSYDNTRYDDLKKQEEYKKQQQETEKARLKAKEEAKKKSMEKEKGSNTGFRSLRIATFGNYQLGMMQNEYDSLNKLGNLIIKTDDSLPMSLKPIFTGERLTSLIMQSIQSNSRLDGFARMIALDYREPDSVSTKYFDQIPENLKDSAREDFHNIIISECFWKNKLHNMTIFMQYKFLQDGSSWGSLTIKFEGNKDYLDMLKSLDKLGD
jgi:hypothetical protein